MLETILLYAFSLLIGLLALAEVAYLLATGRILSLDGITLSIICATIGAVFVLNVAWSVYSGELRRIMDEARKKADSSDSSSHPSGNASS